MLIGKISNNFVGAFYGIFDWEHRTLTYALAGQTKPVVYYPDGRIKLLESTGTALGLVKNGQEAKDNTLLLSQGLKFFFHTDGIQEALEESKPQKVTGKISSMSSRTRMGALARKFWKRPSKNTKRPKMMTSP
jgi:serine phosphatase RsbU (regulator of sigma subunit)